MFLLLSPCFYATVNGPMDVPRRWMDGEPRLHSACKTNTCAVARLGLRFQEGWMDGSMDGSMDGWISGWMVGWMDGK